MILSISLADNLNKRTVLYDKNKHINRQENNDKYTKYMLQGVPRSYISFKGSDYQEIKLTDEAKLLLNKAQDIAKTMGHSEIMPAHVIQAVIQEHEENFDKFDEDILETGVFDSVSILNSFVNEQIKDNALLKKHSREYMTNSIKIFKQDNEDYLSQFPKTEEQQNKLTLSDDYIELLKDMEKQKGYIDQNILFGLAINALTLKGIMYQHAFMKTLISYSRFQKFGDINSNYMKQYDTRALGLWNKLALGSDVVVTYDDDKEVDRLIASFIKTLKAEKYGNFNNDNTEIFAMSRDIKDFELLEEIALQKEISPDKLSIYMVDFDSLIVNSTKDDGEVCYNNGINQIIHNTEDNIRLVFFQSNDLYYNIEKDENMKVLFKNFLTYSIPPIQIYEMPDLIKKSCSKDLKHTFSRDAKERIIHHAGNMTGIFPDKALNLMKRISVYYGDSKKKITAKEVDEFAQIAHELFNKQSKMPEIVYDTGKTLASMYGKETTKKDVEAIIKQIKSGNIGTRGILIYSKDPEAGSGRRYTVETIAGEAKVPFISINSSDFAKYERVLSEEGPGESPKSAMSRVFSEAKKVARQNQYKTAIIFINNFEEFAFSSPYLPGYKQAMTQLTNEMQHVADEDVNLLVIGSTEAEYAEVIPQIVRGFNQNITVDSPSMNKKARREILERQMIEQKIPFTCRNSDEREYMFNKLVKLTEYMSFVEIKSLVKQAKQLMYERNKKTTSMGEFIEAYLQMCTGRTSHPEMPEFNKQATTSHECGHATNLEVMNDILKRRGKPWHQSYNVNFITLDPRGDFLGAVFEGKADNTDYPFEAMFTGLVCSYGGYSCEKKFFGADGSAGIGQDLAQASAAVKRGIEYFGFGFNTGKISNAAGIKSMEFHESVFKDMKVILENAKIASDLITDCYQKFNEWFTQKYSKLIGSDDCMVDGDEFRKTLSSWRKALPDSQKKEINIMEDMIIEIIDASKKGNIYGQVKKIVK